MYLTSLLLALLACTDQDGPSELDLQATQDDLGPLEFAEPGPSPEGDLRIGGAALSVSAPAYFGTTVTFTVTGAIQGETVYFAYGINGQGPGICPGPMGGTCLDIVSPVNLIGTDVADASGEATMDFSFPANGPNGFVVSYQAAIPRGPGGADSVVTNVLDLSVTYDNVAPVAVDDNYVTDEDVNLVTTVVDGVLANDSDADLDVLTVVPVSLPSLGSINMNPDGTFLYTPDNNVNGVDQFDYQADDGVALSNVATITITINAVNDPPVGQGELYNGGVIEDTLFQVGPAGGVLANDGPDPEGDPFTAVIDAQPDDYNGGGQVTLLPDGAFQYMPSPDFNGTTFWRYRAVDDGGAQSAPIDVEMRVGARNDPPSPVDDFYPDASRDTVYQVAAPGVLANDDDIDGPFPLTAEGPLAGGLPQNGEAIVTATGALQYTPDLCYTGADSFEYKAIDGNNRSTRANVFIQIGAYDPPDPAYCDLYTPVVENYNYNDTPFQGFETWTIIPQNPIGLVFAFHGNTGSPNELKKMEWVTLFNDLYAAGLVVVAPKSTNNAWDTVINPNNNDEWDRLSDLRDALIASTPLTAQSSISSVGYSGGSGFVATFSIMALGQGWPVTSMLFHNGPPVNDPPDIPAFFVSNENDNNLLPDYNAHNGFPKEHRLHPETPIHPMVFTRNPDIWHQLSLDHFDEMVSLGAIDSNGIRLIPDNQMDPFLDAYPSLPGTPQRGLQVVQSMRVLWALHRFAGTYHTEESQFVVDNL